MENNKTGERYAAKSFKKSQILKKPCVLKGIRNEIEVNCKISHPNVAKFIEVQESPTEIFLIFEFVKGEKLIFDDKENFKSDEEVNRIIYILLEIVKNLKKLNIVHRDIKPSNILYSSEFEEEYKLKVVDFGLSSFRSEDIQYFCGTPGFIAPELYFDRNLSHFNSKIDVFSIGVVFHYLQFGCYPQKRRNLELDLTDFDEDHFKISRFNEQIFETSNFLAFDLVQKMLRLDQEKRFTVEECLKHPYFKQFEGTYYSQGGQHDLEINEQGGGNLTPVVKKSWTF